MSDKFIKELRMYVKIENIPNLFDELEKIIKKDSEIQKIGEEILKIRKTALKTKKSNIQLYKTVLNFIEKIISSVNKDINWIQLKFDLYYLNYFFRYGVEEKSVLDGKNILIEFSDDKNDKDKLLKIVKHAQKSMGG